MKKDSDPNVTSPATRLLLDTTCLPFCWGNARFSCCLCYSQMRHPFLWVLGIWKLHSCTNSLELGSQYVSYHPRKNDYIKWKLYLWVSSCLHSDKMAQPSWLSGVLGVSLQFLHFVLPCFHLFLCWSKRDMNLLLGSKFLSRATS